MGDREQVSRKDLPQDSASYCYKVKFSQHVRFRESREGRFHDHNIPDFAKDSDPGF
jgi:hypothetical protein